MFNKLMSTSVGWQKHINKVGRYNTVKRQQINIITKYLENSLEKKFPLEKFNKQESV